MGNTSTVAELARACMLNGGAMTRMLVRLEAKNLCRRTDIAATRWRLEATKVNSAVAKPAV